jgi:hypothetical protein
MTEEEHCQLVLHWAFHACARHQASGQLTQGIAMFEWLNGARAACDYLIVNDGDVMPQQLQRAVVWTEKTLSKAILEAASPTNTSDATSQCPHSDPKGSL